MYKTTNNDDGSLKVGTTAGDRVWKVGDKIRLLGEGKVRTVTYVMGGQDRDGGKHGEKVHLCFKGQGKLPMGEVEYELVGDVVSIQAA